MNIKDISLTKKLIILFIFAGLFSLILLLSIIPKSKFGTSNSNIYPTKVPVVISQNSKSTLPKSEIQSPFDTTTGNLGKISFDIASPNLPTTGTLYNIAPSSIPTDVISRLKSVLLPDGVQKTLDTPNGEVIMITQNQKTLMVYSYSRTIVYTDTNPTPPNKLLPFVELSKNFINSLSLAIDDSDPNITYYSTKTSDLTEVGNYNASDVVDVSFREAMNKFVVYRQFGSDSRTHVWITKNGGVTKLTYLYSPVYEPRTSISLPTLEEAENKILNHQGTVVSIGDEYQQGEITDIERTSLKRVSFGYFSDTTNNALYPIFVFTGNAFSKGVFYPIIIYLPVDGQH